MGPRGRRWANLRGWCANAGRGIDLRKEAMKAAVQIPIFLWLLAGSLHAAGPIFSAILGGLGQEYATSVTSDAQGNVYVVGLTYSDRKSTRLNSSHLVISYAV